MLKYFELTGVGSGIKNAARKFPSRPLHVNLKISCFTVGVCDGMDKCADKLATN